MTVPRSNVRRHVRVVAYAITAAVAAPAVGGGQLIAPKTVPVAQGDQFDIFPSSAVGMGGARIALADTLLDPFVNPAKATRLGAARFFSAPVFYSVSGDAGGGRTIPVGSVGRMGAWTGVATVALQQLDKGTTPFGPAERLSDRTAINHYAAASVARPLGTSGWSVGAGAEWAGLDAVDGVNLLYNGSDRVEQAGHMVDARVGVTRDWADGRSLEVLVLHNRFAMTHDVTWRTWTWDPVPRQSRLVERVEQNEDRTNVWGAHAEYERPLASGWRLGYLATANRLSHPKIPNYVVMSIPRDPGTTYAYNLGVGVARTLGAAAFAADVVYEPMWSETWADAERDTAGTSGGIVPRGARTVENAFRFSNALVRMGVGRDATLGAAGTGVGLGVRAGLALRSITYRLEQENHLERSRRTQRESWMEWTPTWGLSLRFPEIELRYNGRYTAGVGRPGVAQNTFALDAVTSARGGGGIIVAPSGPLTLQSAHVISHQVTFALPLR